MKNIDRKKIGSKAANLRELQAIGIPVKPFQSIFVDEVERIEHRNAIPKNVIGRLTRLKDGGAGYSVRSSACGEGENLSWHGQFDTKLNVLQKDLEATILFCAKARNGSRAKAYGKNHATSIAPLALMVQVMAVEMVRAGALYTTDSKGVRSECVLIESVGGSPDDLMSGLETPYRVYVNRETGTIVKEEGEKKFALSLSQIRILVEIAKRVREFRSSEREIEWCFERDDTVFVNQDDELMFPKSDLRSKAIMEIREKYSKERMRLQQKGCFLSHDFLSDQNIVELLTPHPTQMGFGLFTYCFAHGSGAIKTARNDMGYDIGDELETGFFELVSGQPRCSIVHDSLTYRIKGIPLEDHTRFVAHYLERISKDASLGNYPEVHLYEQDPSIEFLTALFGEEKAEKYYALYEVFFQNICKMENTLKDECLNTFLPHWHNVIADFLKQGTQGSVDDLVRRYALMCEFLRTQACPMFVKVARLGFFAFSRLQRLLGTAYSPDIAASHLKTLTGGISPDRNPNYQFNRALLRLKKGETTLEGVLSEFGHLAEHELEVSVPRYLESPELLHTLAQGMDDSVIERFTDSTAASFALRTQLLVEAKVDGETLKREVEMTRIYLALREIVKFHYLKGHDILRRLALSLNSLLGFEDGLIFHLDPVEVFALQSADEEKVAELVSLALARKASWQNPLYVPGLLHTEDLGSIGEVPAISSNVLQGVGVTNFIHEGPVVVLTSLRELEKVTPGSVLVTVNTDPAWSPVFGRLGKGAVVTEVGGIVAHAARCANELGLAAVLNVANATTILKTGMMVRVNGPTGKVEIL